MYSEDRDDETGKSIRGVNEMNIRNYKQVNIQFLYPKIFWTKGCKLAQINLIEIYTGNLFIIIQNFLIRMKYIHSSLHACT